MHGGFVAFNSGEIWRDNTGSDKARPLWSAAALSRKMQSLWPGGSVRIARLRHAITRDAVAQARRGLIYVPFFPFSCSQFQFARMSILHVSWSHLDTWELGSKPTLWSADWRGEYCAMLWAANAATFGEDIMREKAEEKGQRTWENKGGRRGCFHWHVSPFHLLSHLPNHLQNRNRRRGAIWTVLWFRGLSRHILIVHSGGQIEFFHIASKNFN